jgi:microcystin-dependent protein
MSEYFIGQIMTVGFGFAPKYFAQCNGQLLPIAQNQALFSLLGTQYGGNGVTNFALPDMRGRTPVGYDTSVDPGWQPPSVQIGEVAGVENVTLLTSNLPAHTHGVAATTTAGTTRNPRSNLYAAPNVSIYGPSSGTQIPLNQQTLSPTGGTQPHPNMQPYSCINFCIALQGIFPSRN